MQNASYNAISYEALMGKRPGDSAIQRLEDLRKKIADAMQTSANLRRELGNRLRKSREDDLPVDSSRGDEPSKRR